MALCPKRIEVDARRGRVLVDGLIFPYPLADRQPYPEVGRDDLGIVWVPLIADETEAQVSNPRKRNGHRRRLEQQRWRHMQADCYICYRPIDYTLRSPDPYSFVIDETIPLARGGTLTHDNSGPAHRWCNAIKGTHSLAWARERVAHLITQGKAPQRAAQVSAGPIRCSDWFGGRE